MNKVQKKNKKIHEYVLMMVRTSNSQSKNWISCDF